MKGIVMPVELSPSARVGTTQDAAQANPTAISPATQARSGRLNSAVRDSQLPTLPIRKEASGSEVRANATFSQTELAPRQALKSGLQPQVPATATTAASSAQNTLGPNINDTQTPLPSPKETFVSANTAEPLITQGIGEGGQGTTSIARFPKLELGKQIGDGFDADVWLSKMKINGRDVQVAVKKHIGCEDEDIQKEAEIAVRANGPNVIHTYGIEAGGGIVMEPASTDMGSIIDNPALMYSDDASDIAKACIRQMINGLHHIFTEGIAHNDAKPSNFLYKEGVVSLADFGDATLVPKGEYRLSDDSKSFPAFFSVSLHKDHLDEGAIPEEDAAMIDKMYNRDTSDEINQLELKRDFDDLNSRVQKWDCLSNQELDQRLQAFLQRK
jgi:Protein kinase domain